MKKILKLFVITIILYSCGTSISQNNDEGSIQADFSSNIQLGTIPLEVNFEDCSKMGDIPIISWEWDFGDGNTSTTKNPIHIYETQGNYTVSLTVSDSSASDTKTRSNYISAVTFDSTYVGSDGTLDVITWNLKEFPLSGDLTIEKVVNIIEELNPDFIALQEMWSEAAFNELKNSLENWDGYRATSAAYDINIAILYKMATVQINTIQEIFTGYDDWWAFPRSPLVADITFMENNYTIINNHFKAGGGQEDEERRFAANTRLKEYLDDNLPDSKVILLGDLNDEITDPEYENVFWCFIEDPDDYQFADMGIAEGSSYYWSFPSWPSHIDHVLITNELYDQWENGDILTLRIGDYWQDYSSTISDHRPVLIKLTP